MDPLVKRVAARAVTAGLEKDPEKLFAQMKKAVEALLEARVEMRRVTDALGEIKRDASGVWWTNNYQDPEIEKAHKTLYDLDHQIGMGFRDIEWMERQLKPKAVRSASETKVAETLKCDMEKDCKEPVTHIDNKGFVYCSKHGERRKAGGVPTRALRPGEVKKLEQGETVKYR